jgi:hypothetical protein
LFTYKRMDAERIQRSTLISASVFFLRFTHIILILFIVLAWAAPWRWAWLAHVIFVPLMILHWLSNGGTCILTNLETWLLGEPVKKPEQQGGFLKWLISFFSKKQPPDWLLGLLMYLILGLVWSVSVFRLI